MPTSILEPVLAVGLETIFLVSAVPKLRLPRAFALRVIEYRVLPTEASRRFGILLPPSELFVALVLLSGSAIRIAAAASSAVLITFMLASVTNIARGRRVECGCFGSLYERHLGWGLVIGDGVLLACALGAWTMAGNWTGLGSWSVLQALPGAARSGVRDLAVCGALSAALFLFVRLARPAPVTAAHTVPVRGSRGSLQTRQAENANMTMRYPAALRRRTAVEDSSETSRWR